MKLLSEEGRKLIRTSRKITGNAQKDSATIAKILNDVIPVHNLNVTDIDKLFSIYFNKCDYWRKDKASRSDINNKITVGDAFAITRTITGYCFGEPIKYVSRNTNEKENKQEQVEILSQFLDYQHNHDATIMASLSSSVCGLGYKLALPSNREEFAFSGIPFVVNNNFIQPQKAFCVYSADITGEKVLGVLIDDHYNDRDEKDGFEYTVWTKFHKFLFKNDVDGYKLLPFENATGKTVYAEVNTAGRVPLIEVERNAFRKGDWEIALDLLECKNSLLSGRLDDTQQIIDYVMVLTNCEFESEEDRKTAVNDRLIMVKQKDPKSPPKVEILKNPLDQNGVQTLANYIDELIETTVGIPRRSERLGGGHDTGKAVINRNGFRDLENNAGIILPKMDKAELEFLGVCLSYSHNLTGGKDKLKDLKPFDIRCKFMPTFYDDPLTASTSYATFKSAGMNDLDALIASRAVTDPAEVHKNNTEKENEITAYMNAGKQIETNLKTTEDNR